MSTEHNLKNAIARISPSDVKEIEPLDMSDLFLWLARQGSHLRYHLALELDIPLQHLENTLDTIKKISEI